MPLAFAPLIRKRMSGAVSRVHCKSELYDMDLVLDVNTDIYKLRKKEKFGLALATTLRLDGAPDEGHYDQATRPRLACMSIPTRVFCPCSR